MDPELAALQQAIQVLHHLMTVLQDPQAVAVVGTCLQNLTKLQQAMMQAGGAPGGTQQQQMAQAVAQRLQGAGGAQLQAAQAGGY